MKHAGIWIVLIGPDGVGKTSVAERVFSHFSQKSNAPSNSGEHAKLDFGCHYHHWIPSWTHPLATKITFGGTRAILHKGRFALWVASLSILRLARNVLRAWLAYWLQIRPLLRRGHFILGDRYLLNYWLDAPSVRYFASSRWVRMALRCVPKPDLIISLVATPETIRQRKPELNLGEIVTLIAKARQLPLLGWPTVEINAEPSLADVVASVIAGIHDMRS